VTDRRVRLAWMLAGAAVLVVVAAAGARTVALIGAGAQAPEGAAAAAEAAGRPTVPVRTSLAGLPEDPAQGRTVIVPGTGPPTTDAEARSLERFVDAGGRLLALGDRGLPDRFDLPTGPGPVRAAEDPTGPVPARAAVEGQAHELALPGARAVLVEDDPGGVAAESGNATFLDLDGDGRATREDAAGPFPLAGTAADGRVLVLGTPGLATEAALERADNRAFLVDAIDAHGGPGRVLVDRSAAGGLAAPLASLLGAPLGVGERPVLGGAVALAGLAALAVGVRGRPDEDADAGAERVGLPEGVEP